MVHFWVLFLISFFIASWLHLGPQKWPKRLQDDTSKHLKVIKNHVCFSCFLHIASFVALMLLHVFLGPSWCQLGLSRAVFGTQNRTQNGAKIGSQKMEPCHSAEMRKFFKNSEGLAGAFHVFFLSLASTSFVPHFVFGHFGGVTGSFGSPSSLHPHIF